MSASARVVDLDKLKIPFAIDASGRWVKAPEVDLTAPPIAPTCPGCGELVTFRRGSTGLKPSTPHFAHRPGATHSDGGYEGLAHIKLKEAVADLAAALGADAIISQPPAEVIGRRDAAIEATYPGTASLRSDVGVSLGDGRIVGFEIVVRHELTLQKVNEVTAAGNLVAAMNGFGFTEHIMQNGGTPAFDIDADARAFVLHWRFSMRRGVAAGSRMAAPAGVVFTGGMAVNCHAAPGNRAGSGGAGNAALAVGGDVWRTRDVIAEPLDAMEQAAADLSRQHALRRWHTRPDLFPLAFPVHWERGDFGSEGLGGSEA